MRRTSVAIAVLSTVIIACASGSHSTSSDSPRPAAPATDQSRLTGEEIAAANLPTAYELVDHLRRPWLRRDPMTGGEVAVYMDEQNLGGADKLRDIPAVNVIAMRYMNNAEAVQRWGNAVTGAVILITPRR